MQATVWRRSLSRVATVLLAAPACFAASAQDADVDPFHWAYAPMFGSGVYRLSDDTEARIVRLSLSKWLRDRGSNEERRFRYRLLFPLSVGVQNLDDDDLPPGRESGSAEHVAFLPGVELEFPRTARWTLRVRGQVGWGKELEGAEHTARMAALGVRSRLAWRNAAGRPSLINGLLWAGFDPDEGGRRSLLRATHALEFDVSVPRWKFREATMHLRPHVLGDWYYRPPDVLSFTDEGFEHVESEWQLGVSAGREGGFEILGFEFDGVGIAYRFSDHSQGLRIYFGSVF